MIYQIVHPFTETIYGDSFKQAIKNYIKINRNLNINQMIVTDQTNHIKATMKYYKEDIRNKVGINIVPVSNTAPYLTVGATPFLPLPAAPFLPLQSGPLVPYFDFEISPMRPVLGPAFIPTVIDLPRGI